MLDCKIRNEKKRLQKEKAVLQKKIDKAPPGDLRCRKNGTHYKYYHVFEDGTEKYIPKDREEFTNMLAVKKYQKSRLKDIEKEEAAINAYLKIFEKTKSQTDDLLSSPAYKPFLCRFSEDPVISEWMSHPSVKNNTFPQQPMIPTSEGSLVRSKSEAIIAEALFGSRLAYLYESALTLDNGVIYPDFTIMHPVTHEIYYWEHLGMIDKQEYFNHNMNKLRNYIRNGIIPSDHLILTWETQNNPLSPVYVEELINYYFL